jgi:Cys-tRNA(Pro)/Cys-tRNA(Cys) deacylase
MDITPAEKALDELNVPYRVFRHSGAVTSLEQAAQERDQLPEQVVRSIVFRLGEGEFILVLMAGPGQISWPALRAYLGLKRMTMATREDLLESTGFEPGTVSPFGTRMRLRTLIDASVLAQEEVSLGSGVRGVAIVMRVADLLLALPGHETGRFAA